VVETPREILEAQLASWENVLEGYAAEDEFFASVLESQEAFATRAVALKARINPPLDVALERYGQ
jgi:TRAP-type mannitol/chloroaromatic compound transport system substrate-binding protein